jgi:hypothetical protein
MAEFKEIPGQESWGSWPTTNNGWRLVISVIAALILLSIPLCVIGVTL